MSSANQLPALTTVLPPEDFATTKRPLPPTPPPTPFTMPSTVSLHSFGLQNKRYSYPFCAAHRALLRVELHLGPSPEAGADIHWADIVHYRQVIREFMDGLLHLHYKWGYAQAETELHRIARDGRQVPRSVLEFLERQRHSGQLVVQHLLTHALAGMNPYLTQIEHQMLAITRHELHRGLIPDCEKPEELLVLVREMQFLEPRPRINPAHVERIALTHARLGQTPPPRDWNEWNVLTKEKILREL